MDRYAPIVAAAGYLDGTVELTPEDCYFLAGKLMKDAEVIQTSRNFTQRNGVLVDIDYASTIESLGDERRAALRARIDYKPLPILRGGPSR